MSSWPNATQSTIGAGNRCGSTSLRASTGRPPITASRAAFPARRTSAFSTSCDDCPMSFSSAREPCVPKATARCGLDPASVQLRRASGLADQPVFAIVSGTLGLDPESAVFTKAPVKAIVVTVGASSHVKKEALSRVADVARVWRGEARRGCHARRVREARAPAGALRRRSDAVWHASRRGSRRRVVPHHQSVDRGRRRALESRPVRPRRRGAWRFITCSFPTARSCCGICARLSEN